MDLILRDEKFKKVKVIKKPSFACNVGLYGASKNDFELTLSNNELFSINGILTYGTSEFGGVIRERIIDEKEGTVKYVGKSFRGQMENTLVNPFDVLSLTGTDHEIITQLIELSQLDYSISETSNTESQTVTIPIASSLLKAVDIALTIFNEKMILSVSNDGVKIQLKKIETKNNNKILTELIIDDNRQIPTGYHARNGSTQASVFLQANGSIGDTRFYTGFSAYEIGEELTANNTTQLKALATDKLKALINTKNNFDIMVNVEDADIGDKLKTVFKKYNISSVQTICEKILSFDGTNEIITYNTGG